MGNGGLDSPPAPGSAPDDDVAGGNESLAPVPVCGPDDSVPGITIRPLRAADLEDLRLLDRLLFPVNYSDSFYLNLLTMPNLSRIAVNSQHQIVGCVTSRLVSTKATESSASVAPQIGYISTLGVNPMCRRQGVGRRLLKIALEELSKECRVVVLHVKAGNMAAIKLYLQAGFVRVEHLSNHYFFDNRYHDAIQLQRGQYEAINSFDSALERDNVNGSSWLSRIFECAIL